MSTTKEASGLKLDYIEEPYGTQHMNKYIKKQLKRLVKYKLQSNTKSYWDLYERLTDNSKSFLLLELYNWEPVWYKKYSLVDMQKILKDYNNCKSLQTPLKPMKELWIKSGIKWRNLNIATKGTRLLLSGFNRYFLLYLDSSFCKPRYHGFFHGRGVSTYWRRLLSDNQDLLKSEYIAEADFASCFPNINRPRLYEILKTSYNLPTSIIEMIKRHVSVPIKQSPLSTIKSKTGLIERILNSELINSDIGLAQGLPISPTLANIIIKDGLENMEKELNIDVPMLCYADDISMYCGRDLYDKLGGDSFVSYLNST